MKTPELAELDDVLRRAALSEILPRFRCLKPGEIHEKGSALDLVTDADLAAEAQIARELRLRYPGALVLGEESVAANPRLLDTLPEAELAFIIDPIDGTANFAAGLSMFGVMLAIVRRDEVVGAVIHDPLAGNSAIAGRGEGAWLREPDGALTRLRVSSPAPLSLMRGSWSWRYFPHQYRPSAMAAAQHLGAIYDFRCAAHHYRMLACGHAHFSLYYRLLPWDHAPGWLIHHEAGGEGRMLDGSDYRPSTKVGGYLCAPDRGSWEEIKGLIKEVPSFS